MWKVFKSILDRIKMERYHRLHKKAALKILKQVELENGKVSDSVIKQCNEYAKKKLGSIKYAPWLYVYSAMNGKFKSGWIPDNYYGEVIVAQLEGEYARPSRLKPLSNRILNTNKLPDLLYINNGLFIKPGSFTVITVEQAYKVLFSDNEVVIFKENESSQGKGIHYFRSEDWNDDLKNIKNGVFQKVIFQHPFFDSLFPHPGATVRMTTALDDLGQATLRTAYLRLGRAQNEDGISYVKSSSAIKIPINIKNGELSSRGYYPSWKSIEYHPDTHAYFKNKKIPNFELAVRTVVELHQNYPFVKCIGWDVTINSKSEVEVMEWNAEHNDIKFSEAIHGPCFSDFLH